MSDQNPFMDGTNGSARSAFDAISTPGALLRHYREERGVPLHDLAAVLKVGADKLDALERDDYDKLPDMVFTRALSMSICRLLGVDVAPVMDLFPKPGSPRLTRDSDGLNQTFKVVDQPVMGGSRGDHGGIPRSALVIGLLLLLLAAGVFFWPQLQQQLGLGADEDAPAAIALNTPAALGSSDIPLTVVPSTPTPAAPPGATVSTLAIPGLGQSQSPSLAEGNQAAADDQVVVAVDGDGVAQTDGDTPAEAEEGQTVDQAADAEPAPAEAVEAPATATGDTIRITALEPVWILIRDGSNAILHQSTMPKGRELAITNDPPLRVEIGRADAVQVTVRGQAFDVQPFARGNVARFEVAP